MIYKVNAICIKSPREFFFVENGKLILDTRAAEYPKQFEKTTKQIFHDHILKLALKLQQ